MTSFIDAAVFLYAGGSEHPLKEHRFLSIRRAEAGFAMATHVLGAFAPVLPVTTRSCAGCPCWRAATPR